jgi:hypothetical protein
VGGQNNDGAKEACEFPPVIAPTAEKVQTMMATGSTMNISTRKLEGRYNIWEANNKWHQNIPKRGTRNIETQKLNLHDEVTD